MTLRLSTEASSGRLVGTETDVYALGGVLVELGPKDMIAVSTDGSPSGSPSTATRSACNLAKSSPRSTSFIPASEKGGYMNTHAIGIVNTAISVTLCRPLPSTMTPAPEADPAKIVADPGLPSDQREIVLPRFDEAQGRFASGSESIRPK